MFYLREVFPDDLPALYEVAAHLDSVNLPADRAVLEGLIDLSRRSFSGQLDLFKRQYLFALLERLADGGERVVGTSMIHAQHGTRRAPHIFFDVLRDERYSESLDRHMVHRVLRIGYNYSGPTEIGGLVLQPELRKNPLGLGRWLSYVRFLYMGLHRDRFRDEVLSELMPPLEADGTSLLWESLGRHFTGMSYQEADRISQTNKEFIRTLFPAEPIYVTLLPPAVQEIVGVVGPETRGVEKMLRKIGFYFAERIDPFDGGPHFVARTDDITLVRDTRRLPVSAAPDRAHGERAAHGTHRRALVSVERDRPPHFQAIGAHVELDDAGVRLGAGDRAALGVVAGDEVGVLHLE